MTDKTLQERLRDQGQITKTIVLGAPSESRVLSERFIHDPLCHEAADALDAQAERIKALEGALDEAMDFVESEFQGTTKDHTGTNLIARARALLGEK